MAGATITQVNTGATTGQPRKKAGAAVVAEEQTYRDLVDQVRTGSLASSDGVPNDGTSLDDLPMQKFLIKPGTQINLADMPTEIVGKGGKPSHKGATVVYSKYTDEEAAQKLAQRQKQIHDLLAMLHEQGTIGFIENVDADNGGGKDGTIDRTYRINPEWAVHHNFKGPEGDEKQHVDEPNWRFMQHLAPSPGMVTLWCRGQIGDIVFSPDQSEAAKAKRAAGIKELQLGLSHGLPMNANGHIDPAGVARFPYQVINVFLNVSRAEQAQRMLDREHEKPIKAGIPDLEGHFNDYDKNQAGFGDALTRINTPDAPVWVIPADNKIQASLAHATLVYKLLKAIHPKAPDSHPDITVQQRQVYITRLQDEIAELDGPAKDKGGKKHKHH